MLALLLSVHAQAAEPAWSLLRAKDGWEEVGTRETDVGAVRVQHRRIGDTHCLQGVTTSKLGVDAVLDVAADVEASLKFSRTGVAEARTLAVTADGKDMYQRLDIPDWTMVADRYWVVRGRLEPLPDGGKRWRWDRLDAKTAYPALHRELTESGRALEVPVNWGEWSVSPAPGGTEVTYRVCTEVGGAIPAWLQRLAAQRTLPDTMADVLRESQRRVSRTR